MEKQNLFDIKVFSNGEVLLQSKKDGVTQSKTTTLQYFLSTFGQSFSTFETPILPTNCRKIIKSSNAELYIFEYPPSVRSIIYDGETYDNVYCPRAIFVVKIANNGGRRIMSKTDIFLVDPLVPFNENMNLYRWCFNNYNYYKDGRSYICWGSANDSYENILNGNTANYGAFFNLYMSSMFNNHLEPDISYSGIKQETRERMLNVILHLQTEKTFPMSATYDVGDTVSTIIARFKEGSY